MKRTDFETRTRIDAIGSKSNPIVVSNSALEYVDAHFDLDLHVVFDSTCTMLNYHQDFGDNVTISCSPKIEPFEQDTRFFRLDSIGSVSKPIRFYKEVFWRCTIDCNNLCIEFVECEFVECELINNGRCRMEKCPFASVKDYLSTHDAFQSHEDECAHFEVQIEGDYKIYGKIKTRRCVPWSAKLTKRVQNFLDRT